MKIVSENIKDIFLFDGVDEGELCRILEKRPYKVENYERGECIFSPETSETKVGFLLSGSCDVKHKRQDGTFVLLNTLSPPESFGILSVLSENEIYPTFVFARKSSAVLFFDKEDILFMIDSSPSISKNVIAFLTKKILFLNKKISTYSGGTVEEKLSLFLLAEYKQSGSEFHLNCKRCSEELGIGRASVYRAIEALVSLGVIEFCDKKIIVKSPEGLERTLK